MIEKNEIIAMANCLSLNPDTVEKDYVLSWLLWGINNHSDFSNLWLFKGGTSLKKCFFETFRFSEDLDFTVTETAHFSESFLQEKFHQITENIYDETGIHFFKDHFRFKLLPKQNGKISAQGVIQYNGPLRRKQGNTPSFASIKLDLTTDEIIVLQSQSKRVHHPYSDEPNSGIWANCYSFEEVVAEKIRALGERARPRDLYDVVHFFRNRTMIENPQLVYNILTKKCSYKGIEIPAYSLIKNHDKLEELYAQWHNMLSHQLPILPPIESFWQDLESFFAWLTGNLKDQHLVAPFEMDGEIFQPGRVTNAFSINSIIYKIQFAAANRVCIILTYHNQKRTIQPLSFRRTPNNRLFCGYEQESATPKRFTLSKIQDVRVTNLSYTEKNYPVEISASGCD